jgi:hypothetical protein
LTPPFSLADQGHTNIVVVPYLYAAVLLGGGLDGLVLVHGEAGHLEGRQQPVALVHLLLGSSLRALQYFVYITDRFITSLLD